MPGNRRIIYIKNPSQGSNFRTINGSNSNGKKPGQPRKPGTKPTAPPPGTYIGTGGAIYAGTPSNWFQANPNSSAPYFGANLSQISGSIGPYDTSNLLPPLGYGGMRDLKGIELAIALALGTFGAAALTPEMFITTGMYEAAGHTTPSLAAYIQAALTAYGAKGGMVALDSLAGGGISFGVNDSPTIQWNHNTGSYTTEYHDIISAVLKEKDYRNKNKKKKKK